MKRIIWSVVGIAFGILMVVGAVFGALLDDSVECGGKTMRAGDICVSKSRKGVTTKNSLEEQQTSKKVGGFIGIGFGLLFTVIGAHNLRIGIRARKRAAQQAAAPSPTAPPWHHEHPAPQPQYWHPAQVPASYPAAPQHQQPPPPRYPQPPQWRS